MKGKSFKEATDRSAAGKLIEPEALITRRRIRETVAIDKPSAFYDEFYRQITARRDGPDIKTLIKSKEINWLNSNVNPDLNVPQTKAPMEAIISLDSFERSCIEIARTGDVDQIPALLAESQLCGIKPTITAMNYLMHTLIERGQVETFQNLYLQLDEKYGLLPNVPTLTLLLKSYCRSGKLEIADALLSQLKEAGANLHQLVYIWMIEGHVLRRNHSRIMELYWDAKQIAPTNNILSALVIKSCAQHDEVERAFLVYKELLATQTKPSNAVLGELLGACVRRKEYFEEALGIVKQIESYGYPVRLQVYENLLLGCAKNKDLHSACVIWDCLCAAHVASSTAIIHMLWLLGSIENEQNKTSATGTVLYEISSDEIVERAKQLYQHFVLDRRLSPSSSLLSALLSVFCRNQRADDANAIFHAEHDRFQLKRHENSYESMFQMYDTMRDLKSALELRQKAKAEKIPLTFQSYCSLVNNSGLNEQIDVGLELLREMVKLGHKPYPENIRMLFKAMLDADNQDALQELKLLCKTRQLKGSAQKQFANRTLYVDSLLDEVYGPERGLTKERSKRGLHEGEIRKLKNVGLYKDLLQE